MAIAAVTSIASSPSLFGVGLIRPFGPSGRSAPIEAMAAIRRDRGGDPGLEPSLSAPPMASAPGLDTRSAASLVGRGPFQAGEVQGDFDAKGVPKPRRGELEGRLAELEAEKAAKNRERQGAGAEKNAEQASVIAQLKARDGEVRAHESAHIAAGGSYVTGGASYSYQRGPDGLNYAIGGEVGIDSSPIPGKPEETIAKMQVVRAAALAPADPSAADLSVAGAAAQAMAQAMAELAQERSQTGSAAGAQAASRKALPGATIDLVA